MPPIRVTSPPAKPMTMPVICFVSYEFHPATRGGCGVFVRNATDLLTSRGHRVVLLIDCPAPEFAAIRVDHPHRFRAYRVDDVLKSPPPGLDSLTRFERDAARFMHALDAVLKREPIDLVEFFDFCGPAAAYLARRGRRRDKGPPVAVRIHGTLEVLDRTSPPGVMDADRRKAHELERGALALADHLLIPSRAYSEHVLRPLYAGIIDRAIVSQPPVKPLPPAPRRPATPRRIACVGALSRLKGVDQLVEACVGLMRRRADLSFGVDLVGAAGDDGPGPMLPVLHRIIPPAISSRFVFHGHLPPESVARVLAAASIGVFPSRTESFGYAAHEARRSGLPLILRDLPAYRDSLPGAPGCLHYDGSTAGLEVAIESVLEAGPNPAPTPEPHLNPLGDFYESMPRSASPLRRAILALRRAASH